MNTKDLEIAVGIKEVYYFHANSVSHYARVQYNIKLEHGILRAACSDDGRHVNRLLRSNAHVGIDEITLDVYDQVRMTLTV